MCAPMEENRPGPPAELRIDLGKKLRDWGEKAVNFGKKTFELVKEGINTVGEIIKPFKDTTPGKAYTALQQLVNGKPKEALRSAVSVSVDLGKAALG
ncbi:uncharacterized protein LOC144422891 isoform X2 [Styela clava]